MKKFFYVLILLVIGYLVFAYIRKDETTEDVLNIKSFEDCVRAGYGMVGVNPPQCYTPDGRTYTGEKKELAIYSNATPDMIQVTNPFPGAVTGKEFTLLGKARGGWYFEASFPVEVLDKDGKTLFKAPAQAQGDWMTKDFVPFKLDIKVPDSYIGKATLVLRNENPSGLPENEAYVTLDFTIEY
jgi:hypothetical protein